MNAHVSKFLKFIRYEPKNALHRFRLEEWHSKELVDALEKERVLVASEPADWYPCPGSEDGCPRVVSRDLCPTKAKPHFAGCGNQRGCENIMVGDADLETLTFSVNTWWALLQRHLGLAQERPVPDAVFERTWYLGTHQQSGLGRDVLVIMGYPPAHLALILASLRERHPRALVLLPSADGTKPDLIQTYRPGNDFEVGFLEHRLELAEGKLFWVDPTRAATPSHTAVAPRKEATFCYAFDGALHPLTEAGYREAVASADELDLFLDVTGFSTLMSKAGRRGLDGTFAPMEVSLTAGQILARVMLATPNSVRAATLRSGREGGHIRFVQRARQKLDVSLGPRLWKFFPTAAGDDSDPSFVFSPPKGSRYLLLCRSEFAQQVGHRPKLAA